MSAVSKRGNRLAKDFIILKVQTEWALPSYLARLCVSVDCAQSYKVALPP